jgi:transposase
MSNFLTRWAKQASAVSETPAATQREEFENAVASFRKATGKPETRTIPCRCAVTGKAFDIVFERFSPGQCFQIVRIGQDEAASARDNASGGRPGRKPQLKSYDSDEFDWTGYACPHCGKPPGMVYCGKCGETVCAGRVLFLSDEIGFYQCHDACGAVGKLKPASHVHGAAATLPLAAHTARLQPPPAAKRLPGSQRK